MNDAIAQVTNHLLDLERTALERWSNGDPSGFLEITASDVTYFDPFLPSRIDGIDELRGYYESLRGKVKATNGKMLNPRVQRYGNAAVLTFNYVCTVRETEELRWNCTEVYRLEQGTWSIIQTHWSYTKP